MHPGNAIRLIRNLRGLSQKALGEKLEVTQGYVSSIENAEGEGLGLSLRTLTEFADALGTTVTALVDRAAFQEAFPDVPLPDAPTEAVA